MIDVDFNKYGDMHPFIYLATPEDSLLLLNRIPKDLSALNKQIFEYDFS